MPECINCDEEFKGEVIHSRLGITCPKCAEELRILDRELKAEQSVRCDSTILQPISTISQVKRLEIMNTWLRGEWPTIAALSDEAILEVYIRYQFGYEHLKHELNKRKILSFERAVTEKVKELKEKGEAKVARAIKKGEKRYSVLRE